MSEAKKEAAQRLANDLSNFVNGMDNEALNALIDHIMNDHRTLLQLKFKLILKLIGAYSEMKTDARNQYSHDTANEIIEAMVAKRGYSWEIIENTPLI